jgi:hypothetical protein
MPASRRAGWRQPKPRRCIRGRRATCSAFRLRFGLRMPRQAAQLKRAGASDFFGPQYRASNRGRTEDRSDNGQFTRRRRSGLPAYRIIVLSAAFSRARKYAAVTVLKRPTGGRRRFPGITPKRVRLHHRPAVPVPSGEGLGDEEPRL